MENGGRHPSKMHENNVEQESEEIARSWVKERLRPGNWFDISPDEEIPPEITGWWRTLLNMHQICFSPEIRSRITSGSLPSDFVLWGAQLLQPLDGTRAIRLNEEVRCVAHLRTGRDVEKGEPVQLSDLANLEYLDLRDEELDCGHFTILWTGAAWVGAFDFRAGRAKGMALIDKALKFVAAARLSQTKELSEPTIDALHTACELVAKTKLMLSHIPADKWTSHGSVNSALNKERKMGNVDPAFTSLFNRLWDVRNLAKYATGYEAKLPTCDEIDLVEAMALGLKEGMAQKGPPAPGQDEEQHGKDG